MTDVSHFSTVSGGTPTSSGRYVEIDKVAPVEFVAGLEFRPIIGERMLANHVHFAEHAVAPVHTHEEEQIVIILDGELEFEIDGHVRTLHPGDVAVIPAWVPHGARTKDNTCNEIDVFNPPRSTLIDHATKEAAAQTALNA